MDHDQLAKASIDGTELEYLFDDEQWLPATISQYNPGSSHAPQVTIKLLRYPRTHSGIVHLDADDIAHRLRLKAPQ